MEYFFVLTTVGKVITVVRTHTTGTYMRVSCGYIFCYYNFEKENEATISVHVSVRFCEHPEHSSPAVWTGTAEAWRIAWAIRSRHAPLVPRQSQSHRRRRPCLMCSFSDRRG